MRGLKVVGIIAGITIVGCIAFFSVKEYVNSKEDPSYVLNYIKEHKDDKTASLIVKRNGEILTSLNENEKLPLASMSKIVIAIEYAKQVAEGKVRKDEQISLKELEKYYVKNTDGGAHPVWLDDVKARGLVNNGQTSLEEVVKGMIQYSSNANASYLLDKLGTARVNESLKELGLNSHEEFYPAYTAALYMRGYVEKEMHIPQNKALDKLRNMSNDEYVKHVWQIHEWMKDEKEWGKREISLKADMDSQRIWSDRLVGANAKDYMSLMEKINNRNYFTQQMQGEIENIFKGTVGGGMFEYAGQKGGSTAFVLTNSFYGTDKKGNKIEIVFMMNNLSEKEFEKLLSNMDYFIRDIVISEEFRNKL
ncbi:MULTISPECIES: serine hydrolase [Bacillus cereus group]|uniref:D-alanyl-D-alanine carboxypeptidase n=2 Tax=Bacillus cereus group TaxID=86661 RepID=R8QJT5_BACCE|nr:MULTISPECIES: serine hydrolase [Bacillus cereus group]EOP71330.1 D-alanyl-D-alanine carboxypeptidase [Bacillus cereus VD118]MBJ8092108.1 serine hydrolase [Bacillus cereus]MCQ6355252.1 class A beta-lactamase-related serine hydrolase [Bacillus cereus]CAH2465526.1 Beta-lactamase enzyme family [Bacillus mycoides KBAB4]SCB67523.1 D-alanyl-D-alanine carboxypeptidase [Bacillus mycoides]